MNEIEYRAVIKFFFFKKKTPTEIKSELDLVYKDASPSFTTVKYWVSEFKRGRISIMDEARSGRPKTVVTDETVSKVHDLVMSDRRLKLREIADAVGVSYGRVHHILHEVLDMRKLSAQWVPRLLTSDQKRLRVVTSTSCLERYVKNSKDFLRRFITGDKTWVHHYTTETKRQSMQWTKREEPAPKKAKTVRSAGKIMATVFWDSAGIILIDYLEDRKTINDEYYCTLLDRLDVAIKEKRPRLKRQKVLFHHGNARVHTCAPVMAKLSDLRYELVDHPPYSPDLAPCDFFLFPKLKVHLGGEKFSTDDEVKVAVEAFFEEQDKSFFCKGMQGLEKRWKKCIELEGDYVEK